MSVLLNHTIVFAKDKRESASLFVSLFALREPIGWGPFLSVELGQGGLVQFADVDFDIQPQHYAFLVSEEEFDGIYGRIVDSGLDHSADPHWNSPGTFNTGHGGRGVYFRDPAGHGLEALTSPYLSGE
ncbi:glyoxalase [Amycolatopsis antarctica]|uniref:Glyoxalase n=1 Tax=Amycolatopsis antarctica TaxID=1854586 RepID=A0A263D311_9PSEU|nr:VOC family protein [Amycolatopsis antarctica]OZM71856.1 glyoxalase [Amycolatopsis antarctica]